MRYAAGKFNKERYTVKKINLFAVDDEPGICKLFSAMLSASKQSPKYVENGEAALNILSQELFDIVLLDLNLSNGIQGRDLIEKIKNIIPDLKIIIVTGQLLDDSDKKELEKKGADGFLTKPVNMELLVGAIQKVKKSD